MDNQPKRLYRSRKEKIFAGVAGGLAKFYNANVTWVRIAFVILTFLHGFGLILYIVMSIMVPQEPDDSNPVHLASTPD